VNWNSTDYLRASIESIYKFTRDVAFEIIVVDNASPERDVDSLREQFPEITLIQSDKNLGFAGANNLGFKHSMGEYVLFLNPDTRLVTPAIDLMMQRIKALPDAGIVGCKLLNTDLTVQLSSIQKFPTILNQVLRLDYLLLRWPNCPLWSLKPLLSSTPVFAKVEVIPGACMLLRREVFSKVGMFSEEYFMYAEDMDLNHKIKQAGYANYYVGEAAIVHHGGGSSSRQSLSKWSTVMKHRAMLRYYRNTRGRVYEWIYRLTMGCAALSRLTFLALAYPLGNVIWNKESIRIAFVKWMAVLEWATGRSA
jgi:N-acetylglucosaminyl-diphospho-decaprenol L-rhamnosyltransferase